MSLYAQIDKHLNNIISEFKDEAKRVHLIAEQGTYLDARDMEHLAKANARGIAAQTIKNVISLHLTHNVIHAEAGGKTEEEAQKEALPRVIRAIQDKLDIVLRSETPPHVATIVIYNDVLNYFRMELASV